METVSQRHRPRVDFTLSHGSSQCSGLEVVQGDTTAFHLEVEGLTTQVRNATHFHVSFFNPFQGRDSFETHTYLYRALLGRISDRRVGETPQPTQTAPGRLCRAIGTFPEPLVAALPYRRGPTKAGESF